MRLVVTTAVLASVLLVPPAGAAALDGAFDTMCAALGDPVCPVYYVDADRDGWGVSGTGVRRPLPTAGRALREGDCDDGNPSVHPQAPEAFNSLDEDCDGAVDEAALVVTEIMADPAAVPDSTGEFVEIKNPTAQDAALAGVELHVGSRVCALSGVVNGGEEAVVARSRDNNGGFIPDVVCSFSLPNAGTEVRVTAATGLLDFVDYTEFTHRSGASMSLDPSLTDRFSNDVPESWCPSRSRMSGGDAGTPGARNDFC